jgi:2-keto-3-deoxygluconate permease
VGVFVFVVSGGTLFVTDKLIGGNGLAGLAAASTAGNAAAVPALVAAANPAYKAAADKATILVAASIVVTALLTPIVTAAYHRHLQRTNPDALRDADDVPVAASPDEPAPAAALGAGHAAAGAEGGRR